ncbi:MAG: hypothetical protein E7277_00080 [Lachnospiraceae bacterium]|nr:hypothetical protein [Lachnospiraceae bacterium]
MEYEVKIDVVRCIRAMFEKWYLYILLGIVSVGIVFGMNYGKEELYQGYTTIYCAINGTYTATAESMKIVKLNAKLVNSNKIATRAVSIMGNNSITAEDVQAMISVDFSEESPVLGIAAVNASPKVAVSVANAVAEAFVIEASNISANDGVQIFDKAVTAERVSKGYVKNTVLLFAVGFLLLTAVIAGVEILSDRVYHVEDAELDGELELLGVIPEQTMRGRGERNNG